MASDVTAVVLTIGEETTKDAVDSLSSQTLLPDEIIIIENISPFHRALNLGASRVKTKYFIQVDADMILNKNAIEILIKYMKNNVGVVIGGLRDKLFGRVSGVRMFRAAIFSNYQFEDSISPDADFYNAIPKSGWRIIHNVARGLRKFAISGEILGEQRRIYDPLYTFQKMKLLGARIRHRSDFYEFIKRWGYLRRSIEQPIYLYAIIGLSHGIFSNYVKDELRPFKEDRDFNFIKDLLNKNNTDSAKEEHSFSPCLKTPLEIFRYCLNLGIKVATLNSSAIFKSDIDIIKRKNVHYSSIAAIGLCQGLFCEKKLDRKLEEQIFNNLIGKSWIKYTTKRFPELYRGLKRYMTHFLML